MTIHNKRVPLNKDVILLIKGLLVGKILTLVVIGGVLWWLRPHLWRWSYSATPSNQTSTLATATAESSFQTIDDVPFGTFNYGGSTAWAPIRLVVDSQIQNARPELKLRYISPDNSNSSSSSGIRMLLDGKLDLAQSSRPLTPAEQAIAQQRGLTLKQIPVAVDGIAVVVHPSLNIPGLTVDQLQQIYEGKITNWSQVGGPNLAITPFSEPQQEGNAAIFSDRKNGFGSNVQFISSPTEALRQLNQTPGGIYYSSARAVVNQCSVKPIPIGRTSDRLIPPYSEPFVPSQQCPNQRNQPNTEAFANGTYPLTRNLFAIVQQNQGREQQVGEAYTNLLQTAQGQQAITQAGFAWLRQNNSPVAANPSKS